MYGHMYSIHTSELYDLCCLFQGLNSSMVITFRFAHIREKDKQLSLQKLFIHILLLSAVSSVW